jgi:tRNA(Arg) A34 adenosine deaminase TadA
MESKTTTSVDAGEHEAPLRRAFEVARQAAERGHYPFGAVLVGPGGEVLLEAGNAVTAEGGDVTAHAERRAVTAASQAYAPDFLADCTLYASAEPCAMCAGAIYWSSIGRVVFGQSVESLAAGWGEDNAGLRLDLPCRVVLASGRPQVEVVGPLLEEEAAALQSLRP